MKAPINFGDVPTSAAGYSSVGFDSAWLDAISQQSALNNQFNLDQVNAVNAFNAKEAQKNRDFQERMSNTAYQRAVEDLKKAGLNPVLAASSAQGASTPNGYAASGQKASADQTLSSGLISMMSSLIQADSARAVADIYADATRYSANMRDPLVANIIGKDGKLDFEAIRDLSMGLGSVFIDVYKSLTNPGNGKSYNPYTGNKGIHKLYELFGKSSGRGVGSSNFKGLNVTLPH